MPKTREETLAYQRAQYAKHREKRLAAKKATYDPVANREKNRRYYYANQEKLLEYARAYRAERSAKLAADALERYYAGGEELKARRRELSKSPLRRAKQREHQKRWLENNPDRVDRQHAKRLLNEQTGIPIRQIPDDIADAKVEQLKISRWVREQIAASADTHRMAETPKSGSGRSLSGAVPREDEADAQNTAASDEQPSSAQSSTSIDARRAQERK